jgi:hypothetical protein
MENGFSLYIKLYKFEAALVNKPRILPVKIPVDVRTSSTLST